MTKAVGLKKTDYGWRAVYLEIHGDEVVKEEQLGVDSSKAVALEELKVAVVRKVLGSD